MLFKDKLKQYRLENKLTQDELASEIFVSRTLISKWENGVLYPSAENMNKLSVIMKEDVDSLLSDDEAKMLVLENNAQNNLSIIQKILYIISLILISSGVTLLIVGFIIPSDLMRPEDVINSINTITVICIMFKSLGGTMTFIGTLISIVTTFFKIKSSL